MHGHVVGNHDDQMRCKHYIQEPWPRVKARSNQMTWLRVEASQLDSQQTNMSARVACIAEQT